MVDAYHVALVLIGLAIFGAVVLPRVLSDRPLSLPILYVLGGAFLFSLPHGVGPPNLISGSDTVEHLTELVVIVSLMGAGLKIDRPFSLSGWNVSWRLLGIVMPLTIAATALLGYYVVGFGVATAVLLGAVLAPTDPVLASDIEAGPPLAQVEEDHEEAVEEMGVRFGLTSEAGLNDGLAFPFTYLAIVLAGVTVGDQLVSGPRALAGPLGHWLLYYVGYRVAMGVVAGAVLGYALGYVIFKLPASSNVARSMAGAEALAGTLLIYGLTELVSGYGFMAVFVGALVLRRFEWQHDYYRTLSEYAVMVERLLMAVVLVLFGGAIAGGLLSPLTLTDIAVAVALLLVVRPVAGLLGLLGADLTWPARGVIAGFGIRGIGSFYYLAYALNQASFQELELLVAAERLWALVGAVVLGSILVHGVAATPVMESLERREERRHVEERVQDELEEVVEDGFQEGVDEHLPGVDVDVDVEDGDDTNEVDGGDEAHDEDG